jgi:hypothetical protein
MVHHPDVRQGKQRVQPGGVLDQPAVANIDAAELALGHPEGVLTPGSDLRLEMFDPVAQPVHGRIA